MATGVAELSVAGLIRSIEGVESELGTALKSKQAALSQRDAAIKQLEDVKKAAQKKEIKMSERLAALQREADQAQAQVKATGFEKQATAKQLADANTQLQLLLSRRDSNYKDLKERHCTVNQELTQVRDELARVQSRAASHTAVMVALEAELSKTRSTLSQVRGAVAESRSMVSAHEEKVQGLLIKEEAILRKLGKQAAKMKVLRATIEEQEGSMQEQAKLLSEAQHNLVVREQTIAALQREASVLQADNMEHVASKNTIFKHLQESTRLLQESRGSAEQHRAALDRLRRELQDIRAHAAAGVDDAPLQEHEVGSPLLAQAQVKTSMPDSTFAEHKAGTGSAAMPGLPTAHAQPQEPQRPLPMPLVGHAPGGNPGGRQMAAVATVAPSPAEVPQQSASTGAADPAASSSRPGAHAPETQLPCSSNAAGHGAAGAGLADMRFSLAADTPDELDIDSSPPQAAACADKSSMWHRIAGRPPPMPEQCHQRGLPPASQSRSEHNSLKHRTARTGDAQVADPGAEEQPAAAVTTPCRDAGPEASGANQAAEAVPAVGSREKHAGSGGHQDPQQPRDLFASFAAFEEVLDEGALSGGPGHACMHFCSACGDEGMGQRGSKRKLDISAAGGEPHGRQPE